ncbi:MAG: Gfo/Idh/MocA family oxidoreductase, partial [Planctomycetales bacterium]|nr:Gfo/Idh/MocA family oxidoreductase [Planctomycetales bacterium]
MSRLRFAVIGAGHLGKIHARLLKQNERVELVGVVDSVEAAAKQVADEFGIKASSDHNELAAKVDAAIVSTPTVAHEQVASDLIAHGVHVFVEKPITVHTTQAKRLIEEADRMAVALQVGHVEHFNPAWQSAARIIRHPQFVAAHRCAPFSFRSTDVSVVHDLMIHDIELLLSVVDSPIVDVKAWGQCVLTDYEDTATAWIQFHDGRVANLTASRVHHQPVRQMHMYDGNEQIVVDFANSTVTSIDAGAASGSLSSMDPEQLRALQEIGTDSVMKIKEHDVVPGNAIEMEHDDFID